MIVLVCSATHSCHNRKWCGICESPVYCDYAHIRRAETMLRNCELCLEKFKCWTERVPERVTII